SGDRLRDFKLDLPGLLLEDLSNIVSGHSTEAYGGQEIVDSDIAEIIFTSGTTADPKGVCLTHRNVLANIEPLETEIQKYLKYERLVHPLRFLNLLPLSHVFGQFLGIFLPQLMGATVIFHDTLNPSEVIALIRRQRASVLVAVPRVLQSFREKIERSFEELGKLEDFRSRFELAKGK